MTAPTLPPTDATPDEPAPGRWQRVRAVRLSAPELPRAPWLVGVVAGAWAAVIGLALALLPMLVLWMASTSTGLTWADSLRLGGLLWLVANGGAVTIAGVAYSLLPWGLTLIPLALLAYAGGWAVRRIGGGDMRDVAQIVVPGAALYAAIAALVAGITARPTASVALLLAVGAAFAVALLGMGVGAVRASGIVSPELLRHPAVAATRAGFVGALTLIGIGAIAATVSLLLHIDDAVTMAQSLSSGVLGGLGLLALGIGYVPVMAMWGTAYVMGAGVVIAPAVTVSPFIAAGTPTQLPPFPLLAALPQGAPVLAWLLPLAGIAAGVVAGIVVARGARQEPRLTRLALAAGAALVAGLLLALGAALTSGSLGDLRLAQVGPVPLTVGVLGAVLIALGAVPSAIAAASPDRPRLSVANPAAPTTANSAGEAADEATVDDIVP